MKINKIINCRGQYHKVISFGENRFIFDADLEKSAERAGAAALDALTKLINLTSTVVEKSTRAVEEAIKIGEKGVKKIEKMFEPGQPDLNLKEYTDELMNHTSPNYIDSALARGTGNKRIDLALSYYRKMVFLQLKIQEIAAMQEPLKKEFIKVRDKRKELADNDTYTNRHQLEVWKVQLASREAAARNGQFLPNDPRKPALGDAICVDLRNKIQNLEGSLSYIVEWELPRWQKIEFPRGSGQFVDRIIPGGKKTKVNIRELYSWMNKKGENNFGPILSKYQSEIEKLDFHSQKLMNGGVDEVKKDKAWHDVGVPEPLNKAETAKAAIDTRADLIKAGIGPLKFKQQPGSTPRDIDDLHSAEKEKAATSGARIQWKSAQDRRAILNSL